MSRLSILALLFLLITLPAGAAVFVVPLDIALIRDADGIVIGTVTDIHAEFDHDGAIITVIKLDLEEVFKGAIDPSEPLRLHEPGGIIGEVATIVSGAPHYWIGNRALIFLEFTGEGRWNTWGMSGVAAGLAQVGWTDPNPQGVTVKALHPRRLHRYRDPAHTDPRNPFSGAARPHEVKRRALVLRSSRR